MKKFTNKIKYYMQYWEYLVLPAYVIMYFSTKLVLAITTTFEEIANVCKAQQRKINRSRSLYEI